MATNPDRASYFPAIEKKYGQPMSYWFAQMENVAGAKYPEQVAYLKENYGFSQTHANALVMYCRGSKSAHRVASVDDYLADADELARKTVHAMLKVVTKAYPKAETVIAWNQPMVRLEGQYIFGVMVLKKYILMSVWSDSVLAEFRPRLAEYKVNKKTIQVPLDWKPDAALLRAMTAARVAEFA